MDVRRSQAAMTAKEGSEQVCRAEHEKHCERESAMILDPNDFLMAALIVVVVIVVILIVLPYLSGSGRR